MGFCTQWFEGNWRVWFTLTTESFYRFSKSSLAPHDLSQCTCHIPPGLCRRNPPVFCSRRALISCSERGSWGTRCFTKDAFKGFYTGKHLLVNNLYRHEIRTPFQIKPLDLHNHITNTKTPNNILAVIIGTLHSITFYIFKYFRRSSTKVPLKAVPSNTTVL